MSTLSNKHHHQGDCARNKDALTHPEKQPATHGRIADILKPPSDIADIAGFHTLERHPRERHARPQPGTRRCGVGARKSRGRRKDRWVEREIERKGITADVSHFYDVVSQVRHGRADSRLS